MPIRRAVAEDAASIAAINVDSWKSTYRGIIPDIFLDKLDSVSRVASWTHGIEQGDVIWVAEDTEGLAGFAEVGTFRNKEYALVGELYEIYVRLDKKGKGVGRLLFQTARDYCQQHHLEPFGNWVLDGSPAIQFYQSMGGRQIGERQVEIGGANLRELLLAYT